MGRFTVEVIHNSAQLFNNLTPTIQTMIAENVRTAIDSVLKNKFGLSGNDWAVS
jgi:hypothetical protein